jgi:hypothetical protein
VWPRKLPPSWRPGSEREAGRGQDANTLFQGIDINKSYSKWSNGQIIFYPHSLLFIIKANFSVIGFNSRLTLFQ